MTTHEEADQPRRGTSAEDRLLSAILRTGDLQPVRDQGITATMFHSSKKEWTWLESYGKRHGHPGQVPSIEAFTFQFADFQVIEVDDVADCCAQVRREHQRTLLLGTASKLYDRLDGDRDDLLGAAQVLRQGLDAFDVEAGPHVTGRQLRLAAASTIPRRRKQWVWADRIPAGSLTLIPGREGIGKSLFLAWLAAKLTQGELPGIHHGTPKPVIYAATEDSWSYTIANRLVAAGANLDLVLRVDVLEDDAVLPLTLPADCGALTVELQRTGAALLALDPLVSAIAAGIDTHRDRELRTALEPLVAVADATGAAVAGLAHFGKTATSDVMNAVLGSRAFSSVTRAALAMARDPDADDGSYAMTQAKNNLGRLDLPSLRYVIDSVEVDTDEGPTDEGRLRFDGESERSVHDILEDAMDADDRSERAECVEWLKSYLEEHGGAADANDVFKAADKDGHTKRTIQRARHKAKVTSKREGFPSHAVWRLPQSRHPSRTDIAGATGATVAPLEEEPSKESEEAPSEQPMETRMPDLSPSSSSVTSPLVPISSSLAEFSETSEPAARPPVAPQPRQSRQGDVSYSGGTTGAPADDDKPPAGDNVAVTRVTPVTLISEPLTRKQLEAMDNEELLDVLAERGIVADLPATATDDEARKYLVELLAE